MKNNYLFLISVIIIVIVWSLWYYVLIEPMETNDESASIKLQKIMESFSKDISEKIRNLIFTKTQDGEEEVDKDIVKHKQKIQNIVDDVDNTNKNVGKKSKQLLEILDKMILDNENNIQQGKSTQGLSVEILNEQEKIRSIVNKYIQ